MISLTQQERDRFALWLEQEVKSDDEMAKQLLQLNINDLMARRMKQRVVAFSIVAIELRKIEDDSIRG